MDLAVHICGWLLVGCLKGSSDAKALSSFQRFASKLVSSIGLVKAVKGKSEVPLPLGTTVRVRVWIVLEAFGCQWEGF